MIIQDVIPENFKGDFYKILKVREAEKYLNEGYSTGHIFLTGIGLGFELMPTQLYRCNGQVEKLPFGDNNENKRGLTKTIIDSEKKLMIVETYILKDNDPEANIFVQGHEDGHVASYFGKTTETYEHLKNSKNGEIFKLLLKDYAGIDKKYLEDWDRLMMKGMIALSLPESESFEGAEKIKNLFLHITGSQKEAHDEKMDNFCNICGIYALSSAGYKLGETLEFLAKKGF